MNALLNAAAMIPLLPCDAAIPDFQLRRFDALAPFGEVLAGWREAIRSEQLKDYTIDYTTLKMRPEDGALVRKSALGYTRHGSGQLINLLVPVKPSNLNNVLRWIKPAQRAPVFNVDIRDRSPRKSEDLVVMRTTVMTRYGVAVRAIRAVVSTRHSVHYMDDLALSEAIEKEISQPDCYASVVRAVDTTFGMATVGKAHQHITRTLHWQNSETGAASLSFAAGAIIRVVDAPFQIPGREIDADLTVAVAQGRSRVRHTAPGGKDGDEEKKSTVANGRMRNGIRTALAAGEDLELAWDRSLKAMAPGFELGKDAKGNVLPIAIDQWEVLFDLAEEVQGFVGEDRALLMQVMQNNQGLLTIPQGTAAHFAAGFALLGKVATEATESVRYQLLAGQWITKGWKR